MLIVGVDEVGRGCWAGPVVAGAVILPEKFRRRKSWLLQDSKTLNRRQRAEADIELRKIALAIGLGWVDAPTIDQIGLTAAVKLAMQQALEQLQIDYDEIIVDGNYNFLVDNPKARPLIRADASVPAVSAASIVAKVARDNYMAAVCEQYPDYGFERHVGYGTRLHLERLRLHGVSPLHRHSYRPVQALLQ
jgi:ribonuclease HII